MWGSDRYPAIDPVHGIVSVAEATYRFVHGEICDTETYQRVLVAVMDRCEAKLNLCAASDAKRMHMYKKLANERLYGKTSIEMFVALEVAVTLAQADSPDIAFRRYLMLAFPGILALQQSVGPWVDTSDALLYKYGISDMGANVASSCMWFASNFYTKTAFRTGELVFVVAPVREFVSVRTNRSLVGSLLFDYIKLLFPMTSAIPLFNPLLVASKIREMQARVDTAHDLEMLRTRGVYQFGSYGTHMPVFRNKCYAASLVDEVVRSGQFNATADHVDISACLTTIMHCGTNKARLSDMDVVEIDAVDCIVLPFVSRSMNHALRVSAFQL